MCCVLDSVILVLLCVVVEEEAKRVESLGWCGMMRVMGVLPGGLPT